jgi:hypothetical protein
MVRRRAAHLICAGLDRQKACLETRVCIIFATISNSSMIRYSFLLIPETISGKRIFATQGTPSTYKSCFFFSQHADILRSCRWNDCIKVEKQHNWCRPSRRRINLLILECLKMIMIMISFSLVSELDEWQSGTHARRTLLQTLERLTRQWTFVSLGGSHHSSRPRHKKNIHRTHK